MVCPAPAGNRMVRWPKSVDGYDRSAPNVEKGWDMERDLGVENDAFGHALLDFLEGRGGEELVERSDGHIALSADAATYFAVPTGHQQLIADQATGRVLDVGCGAGRYALYLQERGLEVVGIDVSPLAIEVCRRRGVRDARVLSLEEVDSSLGSFNTVLMLGHNLGLLGSFHGAKRILTRLGEVVPPGGALIADTLDPYQTDDPTHLAYHAENRAKGRMGGQIQMRVRYKTYKTPWFDYLFLARDELEEILEGSGWRMKDLIATDGPSYAVHIQRMADGDA